MGTRYKHTLFGEKDIKEAVRNNKNRNPGVRMYGGSTVDEFIQSILRCASQDVSGEYLRTLEVLRQNDRVSYSSKEVINALMEVDGVWDKALFIDDGSYLCNRVWMHLDKERSSILLTPEIRVLEPYESSTYRNVMSRFRSLTYSDKVRYLRDNFEAVFLQIPILTSDSAVSDWFYSERDRHSRRN